MFNQVRNGCWLLVLTLLLVEISNAGDRKDWVSFHVEGYRLKLEMPTGFHEIVELPPESATSPNHAEENLHSIKVTYSGWELNSKITECESVPVCKPFSDVDQRLVGISSRTYCRAEFIDQTKVRTHWLSYETYENGVCHKIGILTAGENNDPDEELLKEIVSRSHAPLWRTE